MRVFATIFTLIIISISAEAGTRQLTDFEQLWSALQSGVSVRAVIYYGECKLLIDGKEESAPAAVGGVELWPYEYFPAMLMGNPRAFISVSETRLISHPKRGYVYNYVKLRIYEDGEVEIQARYLKPKSLKITMDETFKGIISAADSTGGIHLYADE